ncbi:SLOG family protein [Candidatus Soleaferrea massiliensis]|uniref:SLOG family protein n=1 Tax=Candidatus Soleaferrea massiliensis TaxID=1470354 RepID=UPI00058F12CF|nr:SLOG family protein [Candidatus Soleaferrea massiliensis]
MKTAIIGSRTISTINIADYIPCGTTEIITGGAKGVDRLAENFAKNNHYTLTVILPDYRRYGKAAPLKRNELIVQNCDLLIAVWDGKSKGTAYTIQYAQKIGKEVIVCIPNELLYR